MPGNMTNDWGFICGMTAACEDRLLSSSVFEEAVRMQDVAAAFNRLKSSLLCENLELTPNPGILIDQIESRYIQEVVRITGLCPQPELQNIFLLTYDWLDFRNYFKNAGVPGFPRRKPPTSRLSDDALEKIAAGQELEGMENFTAAKRMIDRVPPGTKNRSGIIDLIADGYELFSVYEAAEAIKSPAIVEIIKKVIYFKAQLSVTRARINKFSLPELQNWFFNEKLEPLRLRDILAQDDSKPVKQPDAAKKMAKVIDNRIIALIRDFIRVPFGPEKVFGFIYGLKTEAYNLKLVLSGLIAGLEANFIVAEIRDTYV